MKKRLITTILATTMALAITACGSNTNETTQTADAVTETATEVAEQDTDIETDTVTDEQSTTEGTSEYVILSYEELISLSDKEIEDYMQRIRDAHNEGTINDDTYDTAYSMIQYEKTGRKNLEEISNMNIVFSQDIGGGYEYCVEFNKSINGLEGYLINKDAARLQCLYGVPVNYEIYEKFIKEFDKAISDKVSPENTNSTGTFAFITDENHHDRFGNQYNLAIDIATNELFVGVGEPINNYYKYTNTDGTKTIYFHDNEEITEQEYNDAM